MARCLTILPFALVAIVSATALAQQTPPRGPGSLQAPVPPGALAIAATVNGKEIPELAVSRALRDKANAGTDKRKEILNYLIDNALIDQYLEQMKVEVDQKEIDTQLAKVKKEIEDSGKKYQEFLSDLHLTEAELQSQVFAALRWEKFIKQYGTDKTLKDYFDNNKAVFDGTSMRAKHILIAVPPTDFASSQQAKAKIAALKRQIEEQVSRGLQESGKLDNLELQKKRMQLLNTVFGQVAAKESSCPSKTAGGELGWFPRTGGPVTEAFAKAAFALKPWEMSDAVQTEFGYHLILCVEFKAGIEPKFEDLREIVRDVYADKMREAIAAQMRSNAKITIYPTPK